MFFVNVQLNLEDLFTLPAHNSDTSEYIYLKSLVKRDKSFRNFWNFPEDTFKYHDLRSKE
jgi:hypothetical protein